MRRCEEAEVFFFLKKKEEKGGKSGKVRSAHA
jgi:hypothetical protein